MTKAMILIALALLPSSVGAASAPPKPDPQPLHVGELLDVAAIVCPTDPTPEMLDNAAKIARFTIRDGQTMHALCAMYHLGRRDQIAQDSYMVR